MKKQKEIEITVANFFLGRLNDQYGFDYQMYPNLDESKGEQDVDIYGISLLLKEKLKLQLTTYDGEIKEKTAHMKKEYSKGKSIMILVDLSPDKCIKNAQEKKKLHTGKENNILIIHSEESNLINKNFAKNNFPQFNNSNYRGIFLVLLPSKPNSPDRHNRQIVSIKNCFGKNGVSF